MLIQLPSQRAPEHFRLDIIHEESSVVSSRCKIQMKWPGAFENPHYLAHTIEPSLSLHLHDREALEYLCEHG